MGNHVSAAISKAKELKDIATEKIGEIAQKAQQAQGIIHSVVTAGHDVAEVAKLIPGVGVHVDKIMNAADKFDKIVQNPKDAAFEALKVSPEARKLISAVANHPGFSTKKDKAKKAKAEACGKFGTSHCQAVVGLDFDEPEDYVEYLKRNFGDVRGQNLLHVYHNNRHAGSYYITPDGLQHAQ